MSFGRKKEICNILLEFKFVKMLGGQFGHIWLILMKSGRVRSYWSLDMIDLLLPPLRL